MIKAAELVAAVSALDLRERAAVAPELSTPEEAAAYARETGVETTAYEILEEVKIQRTRRKRASATVTSTSRRPPIPLGVGVGFGNGICHFAQDSAWDSLC